MILGVVLAGGKGTRMGGNKPFHSYLGQPLIAHAIARLTPQVDRLCVNAGIEGTPNALRLASLDVPLIYDDPGVCDLGPLSGIHRALKAAIVTGAEAVVSLPCDMPHVPDNMVQTLKAHQAVSGAEMVYIGNENGHFTDKAWPLCAIWSPDLLPALHIALRQCETGLGVRRFLATRRTATVAPAEEDAYANINQPTAT